MGNGSSRPQQPRRSGAGSEPYGKSPSDRRQTHTRRATRNGRSRPQQQRRSRSGSEAYREPRSDRRQEHSWRATRNEQILPFNVRQEKRPRTEPRPDYIKNGVSHVGNGVYLATVGWAVLLAATYRVTRKALRRLRNAPAYIKIRQDSERRLRVKLRNMRDNELPNKLKRAQECVQSGDEQLAAEFDEKNAALWEIRRELKTKCEALEMAAQRLWENSASTDPSASQAKDPYERPASAIDSAKLAEMQGEIKELEKREKELSAETSKALEALTRLNTVRALKQKKQLVTRGIKDRESGRGYEAVEKWHRRLIERHVIKSENRREHLQKVADEEDRRREKLDNLYAESYTSSDEE